MSKLEESVNEILGIESKEPKGPKEFKPLVPRKENKDKSPDLDNDYTYSRENYYNLIERGQEAVQGILDVAREGQHSSCLRSCLEWYQKCGRYYR
jgi:hypothetical protein